MLGKKLKDLIISYQELLGEDNIYEFLSTDEKILKKMNYIDDKSNFPDLKKRKLLFTAVIGNDLPFSTKNILVDFINNHYSNISEYLLKIVLKLDEMGVDNIDVFLERLSKFETLTIDDINNLNNYLEYMYINDNKDFISFKYVDNESNDEIVRLLLSIRGKYKDYAYIKPNYIEDVIFELYIRCKSSRMKEKDIENIFDYINKFIYIFNNKIKSISEMIKNDLIATYRDANDFHKMMNIFHELSMIVPNSYKDGEDKKRIVIEKAYKYVDESMHNFYSDLSDINNKIGLIGAIFGLLHIKIDSNITLDTFKRMYDLSFEELLVLSRYANEHDKEFTSLEELCNKDLIRMYYDGASLETDTIAKKIIDGIYEKKDIGKVLEESVEMDKDIKPIMLNYKKKYRK